MSPEYKATEFCFEHTAPASYGGYPEELNRHLKDHARNGWSVQQIFHTKQVVDGVVGKWEHFGILWVRKRVETTERAEITIS